MTPVRSPCLRGLGVKGMHVFPTVGPKCRQVRGTSRGQHGQRGLVHLREAGCGNPGAWAHVSPPAALASPRPDLTLPEPDFIQLPDRVAS